MKEEWELFFEDMKKGIKRNPVTRVYLDKMVSDELDEEEALNIMLYAYFRK